LVGLSHKRGWPSLSGSFDLFRAFNFFTGGGSYFGGFEGGYNYVLPSHFLFGVEGDLSFPNTISGNQTVSSASTGQATYSNNELLSGTITGRVGYAFNGWLLYGTAGVAAIKSSVRKSAAL
jgi:high affinity Mn2+ porin